MEQWKIDRINELSRKAKSGAALTDDETKERETLRREYIQAVTGSLEHHLEHTYVMDKQGNKRKLRKKGK